MQNKEQFRELRVKFHPDEIHDAVVNNNKEYFFQFTQKALIDLSQMALNYVQQQKLQYEQNQNKQNTLHLCVWYDRVDIIRFLLDFDEIQTNILNFQDMVVQYFVYYFYKNGETPLHLAFYLKNAQLVSILVKKGANYLIPNRKYQQCFDLLVSPGQDFGKQVISYFKYECQFCTLLRQKLNIQDGENKEEEEQLVTNVSEHNLSCMKFKEDEQDKILSELLNDPRIVNMMIKYQINLLELIYG